MKFLVGIFAFALCVQSCKNKPVACFETDKTEYTIYDTIKVSNCSKSFTDIEWSYSNGAKVRSIVNPKIRLIDSGNFSITLIVSDDGFKTTNVKSMNLVVKGH